MSGHYDEEKNDYAIAGDKIAPHVPDEPAIGTKHLDEVQVHEVSIRT